MEIGQFLEIYDKYLTAKEKQEIKASKEDKIYFAGEILERDLKEFA